MINLHLTDTEVQLYVAEPESISDQLVAHIKDCNHCQSRAANYALLFNGLQHAAPPAFDFELSAMVLTALLVKKSPYVWLPAIAGGFGAFLVMAAMVFFGSRLSQLFATLSSAQLSLLIVPALVLLLMQAVVISRDYRRKMMLLNNF